MDYLIPHSYAEYCRGEDHRKLPGKIDALTNIERRILYSLYNRTKKKELTSATVVGDIMTYHPHGDESIYESLVKLSVIRNFGITGGNYGSISLTSGPMDTKAAMRYTQVKINPSIARLFEELLDEKYIPYHNPDVIDTIQPVFLPSPVPIGLIGNNIFVHLCINKCTVCSYSEEDLFKRLIFLLGKGEEHIIKPKMLNCDVLEDSPGTFSNILTTGEGIIIIKPNHTVDTKNKSITFYGKPPTPYQLNSNTGCLALINMQEEYKYRYVDESFSTTFQVKVIPDYKKDFSDEFIQKIINIMTVKVKIKFNTLLDIVVNEKKYYVPELVSPDTIILNSYNAWSNAYKLKIEHNIENLKNKLKYIKSTQIARQIYDNYNKLTNINELIDIYNTNQDYLRFHSIITKEEFKQSCQDMNLRHILEWKDDSAKYLNLLAEQEDVIKNIDIETFNHMKSIII
jgi:hypothetical protein